MAGDLFVDDLYPMKRILILLAAALLFACQPEEQAYVFTYFDNTHQGAGLLMAVSEDGYHWTAVNGNRPVLVPQVGRDRLMRDPSICQGPDGTYHLVWTVGWTGQSIGYASSRDLVHWSGQRELPVMADYPSTRNTWAPELFHENGRFYIFWASTVPESTEVSTEGCLSEDGYNHRIYMTSTEDFQTFAPTRLYFNPDFNAIDAMVARVPSTGELLMAVKNENLHPAEKNIRLTRGKSMEEGFPTTVSDPVSAPGVWSEGPALLYVGDDLLLFYDDYREHRYGAALSHDDGHTWEDVTDRISMPEGMSHGTAVAVPKKLAATLSGVQK